MVSRWTENGQDARRIRIALLAAAFLLLIGLSPAVRAQETSLSDPLSPSLSAPQSENDGFDTSFQPGADGFTDNYIHADIEDPTHSQLTGSALTPMTGSSVQPYSFASVETSVPTDAQAIVGQGAFTFGGVHSQLFSAGSSIPSASASRLSAMESLGSGTAKAAFNGMPAIDPSRAGSGSGTGRGFSGEGATVPQLEQGAGTKVSLSSTGAPVTEGAYLATDPVLTGSTSGYEGETPASGETPPTGQVSQTFADQVPPENRFQYDDGQTPPLTADPRPGVIGSGVGALVEYTPSPSGFPDSTRGLAGLPTLETLDAAPFPVVSSGSGTLFQPPAVSDGTLFSAKQTLNPTLHPPASAPSSRGTALLIAAEQRAEQQRVASGMALSDSAALYRQAIAQARRARGGRRPRTLEELDSPNRQTSQPDLVPRPTIR